MSGRICPLLVLLNVILPTTGTVPAAVETVASDDCLATVDVSVRAFVDHDAGLGLVPEGSDPWLASAREKLRALGRRGAGPARFALRARIVMAVLFDNRSISEVARSLYLTRDTVRLWVQRYRVAGNIDALDDRLRTGRPPRLGWKEQAVALSIACQRPQDFGRCEGRMTQTMIAEEATRQGYPMKRSSVQRLLAAAEVRPHREAYYLFTRKDDPEYVPRRDALCEIYTRPLPIDEVVVCLDEKSGVQVLGLPPGTPHGGRLPPAYGRPARLEQHYRRHGTRTLVGAVRPDTGALVGAGVFASGAYKTAETIMLLRSIREALPEARIIHLVWDNGSTHRSAEMRTFLATEEGACFHVLPTPVHASWLNLAENFLSRFSRRYLHGKRWTGLEAFDLDMAACLIAYGDVAKPMRWCYNPREQAETIGRRRGPHRGQRFLRPAAPARPMCA
jgi:transposase